MKIKNCRSCSSKSLKYISTLGNQYLTGIFLSKVNQKIPKGVLTMVLCEKCSLLQLENSFDANIMYGDNYGYLSSLNLHMVKHLRLKSDKLKKIVQLKKGDIIIDIGSNDGTFLRNYSSNLVLIGVDPTIKKLINFYRNDIITVADFFTKDSVIRFLKKKKAKIITTISMSYDLLSPVNFAKNIYECLDDQGVWHLEQSYMPMMIKNTSYDTICHEHLEYYSLKSIKYIFDIVGFKIVDLEFNDINGGSFAITVAKKNSKYKENLKIIDWLLNKEEVYKYNSFQTHKEFFKKAKKHKKLLKELLLNLKDMKKKIIGYGASTKGNVILQYCGINSQILDVIVDVNKDKHNNFTPGSKIKIVEES
ncbi:MAG: methyltransferase domain-containing protein [Sphingobacteriia bacterium]|nr:methyltransferase domain-containing protein [Candidatus Fonsibacter lacus]